ncbi:MAG: anhydro-N-acetylmuramic acid kinase [Balneolaceae bacterium]|nr:MAG: anhydro-N-acetylmuramic acid kinase [Balneolaceae bacterium]
MIENMNPSIKKLANLAKKESRNIIGLMSGTSLDGLDIALCSVSGHGANTTVSLDRFITKDYSNREKESLKMISSVEHVKLQEVCYQHTRIAHIHARMILEALNEWIIEPGEIDCIASHGQTIYHLPARDLDDDRQPINSTLQIGDGDHIAAITGILTISDFRQKHVAHGGEGAPMAALVDRLLFADTHEQRILLNIGGIGNFTIVPSKKSPDQTSFTTDTGPGNTLIDKLVQKWFDKPYDKDAAIARSGTVHSEILYEMLRDGWFSGSGAKSTGPEYFSVDWVAKKISNIGLSFDSIRPKDLIATVTELSAITIAKSINEHAEKTSNAVIYVSGGGAHNPLLMQRITEELGGITVKNFSELGINPDAKEALIFAVLANEMLAGEGFDFKTENGESMKLNVGKISFPK